MCAWYCLLVGSLDPSRLSTNRFNVIFFFFLFSYFGQMLGSAAPKQGPGRATEGGRKRRKELRFTVEYDHLRQIRLLFFGFSFA